MADDLMEESSSVADENGSIKPAQLTCIEYPARVQNVDRMLKTLGGEESVSKTLGGSSNWKLQMKFRLDDPYCRALYASKQPTTSLLLRVKKRYRKNAGDVAMQSTVKDENEVEEVVEETKDEAEYQTELVGVINSMYKFKGMCDFQYLPVTRNSETGGMESLIERIIPSKLERSDFLKREVPPFLLPPVFSRSDLSSEQFFQPDIVPSQESLSYKVANLMDKNIVGSGRARRPHSAHIVTFEQDAIPMEAQTEALLVVEKGKERDSSIGRLRDELVQKFEMRPVWSRSALKHNCSLTNRQLTVILPSVSYYFSTGPWRATWVRLGYDPRTDPNSLKYQMLDFRVRKALNTLVKPVDKRRRNRNTCYNRNLPASILKPTKRMSSYVRAPTGPVLGTQDLRKPKNTDAYFIFREGLVPAYNQMFYQLCDIDHEDIQSFIKAKSVLPGQDKPVSYLNSETLVELRSRLIEVLKKTLLDEGQKEAAARELGAGDAAGPSTSRVEEDDIDDADQEEDEEDEDVEEEDVEDELDDSLIEEEDAVGEDREVGNIDEEDDSENEMELLAFLSGT